MTITCYSLIGNFFIDRRRVTSYVILSHELQSLSSLLDGQRELSLELDTRMMKLVSIQQMMQNTVSRAEQHLQLRHEDVK